ncbi:MAG: DUF523 domain-containing protein [Desulfococcaceae bacterium]
MILVSACLAGVRCRYDGGHNRFDPVVEMVRAGEALPVCPEQLGGLTTPREPAEIRDGRVWTVSGTDVTAAFQRGAEEAFRLGKLIGCRRAILKARSPSCGAGLIYDGSFSHVTAPGDGFLARMLREAGAAVFTEEDSLPG